jgi:hypothetical protein
MISIFCGALVIAGLFTFVPGRICTQCFSATKASPNRVFREADFGPRIQGPQPDLDGLLSL